MRGGGGPAAAAPDPAAAEQLVALLRGLGACVSLVHERKHELLLKELLDTPLWQVTQVSACLLCCCGRFLRLCACCYAADP